MRNLKSMLMIVLATVMMCGFTLGNYQGAFAQENKEGDTEIISGVVYQFGEKGNCNLHCNYCSPNFSAIKK